MPVWATAPRGISEAINHWLWRCVPKKETLTPRAFPFWSVVSNADIIPLKMSQARCIKLIGHEKEERQDNADERKRDPLGER